ncbi:MAG: succinylglutamate desuccinylase/aspartoacylase family protein [Dongiaceae bacterium]
MAHRIERLPLLEGSLGTSRHLTVHRYGEAGARPKAYLHAALHADEIPPLLVAHHLLRRLDALAEAGRIRGEIVVVPMANPIGAAQVVNDTLLGRYELGGSGNFNRGWIDLSRGLAERVAGRLGADPAANVATVRAAMTEIVGQQRATTQATSLRLALARLAYDADIVLDLHCDNEALAHLFLIPAHWPEAHDLAAEIGSRAVLLAEDSGGRSFDEAFSTPWTKLAETLGGSHPLPAACLAATVEYRGIADVSDELAGPDADALVRFLQRRGLIEGDPGPLPALQAVVAPLQAVDLVRAPAAGVVAYKRPLGATVAAGEVIAELVDPVAENPAAARTPIAAGTDGLLLSRRLDHLVRPGSTIAKVVGERPLPHRTGLLLED